MPRWPARWPWASWCCVGAGPDVRGARPERDNAHARGVASPGGCGLCWRVRYLTPFLAALCSVAAAQTNSPAVFTITDEVINPGLQPFTATVGGIGNSILRRGGGFEPVVWRTFFAAESGGPDRIGAARNVLSVHDSVRDGFADGASVRVYRVRDGRVDLVREDRVVSHHASGWVPETNDRQMVRADTPSYHVNPPEWSRPDAPTWFTVRALNADGVASAPAEAVRWVRPAGAVPRGENVLAELRRPRTPAGVARLGAPAGLRVETPEGGGVRLVWEPVPGAVGYAVERSDTDPAQHRGYFLELAAAGEPVREGDLVVVEKTLRTFRRAEMLSNRVWDSRQAAEFLPDLVPGFPDEDPERTWALEPHAAGTPVTDAGETCLRLEARGAVAYQLTHYGFAGDDQEWYEVLDPAREYVVEAWLRQEGVAGGEVTFSLGAPLADTPAVKFAVDGTWRRHVARFRPSRRATGTQAGQFRLAFQGPGTLWVDNWRVYRADAPWGALVEEDVAALRESGMAALRTHAFIKTGRTTYAMHQYLAEGAIEGIAQSNTLPQSLRAMRQAGLFPWLQVEFVMTDAEWLALVEYLAAPYDPAVDNPREKPWAALRHAQGQARPWVDEFPRILFELGNETWNGLFAPWTFPRVTDAVTGREYSTGEVYGLWQERVRAVMRSSPWWERAGLDDRVEFVLGGWASQSSANGYGQGAARTSPNSRHMMIAAYNGGWDEGEGPAAGNDASLFRVLTQVPQQANRRSVEFRATLEAQRASGEADYLLGTYEAGPGYALSGLNGQRQMSREEVEMQDRTMKSLAAGTATLDTFLDKAAHGFVIQNFFTFRRSRNHWTSHAAWHNGGQAYPSWMALMLFNREGLGDMVRVDAEAVPVVALPAHGRRQAVDAAPLVAAYATRREGRLNVFVVSRVLDGVAGLGDGHVPVVVRLPERAVGRVTLYRMVGDPRAHNLDAEDVRIERVELPASVYASEFPLDARRGATERGLPPAATYLYVFE